MTMTDKTAASDDLLSRLRKARDMKSDPYGKAWLFLEDCDEDE